MARKAMRKPRKPPVIVQLRPETGKRLLNIRNARGWSYAEMIHRMSGRELAIIKQESVPTEQPTVSNATAPCGAIQNNSCE